MYRGRKKKKLFLEMRGDILDQNIDPCSIIGGILHYSPFWCGCRLLLAVRKKNMGVGPAGRNRIV